MPMKALSMDSGYDNRSSFILIGEVLHRQSPVPSVAFLSGSGISLKVNVATWDVPLGFLAKVDKSRILRMKSLFDSHSLKTRSYSFHFSGTPRTRYVVWTGGLATPDDESPVPPQAAGNSAMFNRDESLEVGVECRSINVRVVNIAVVCFCYLTLAMPDQWDDQGVESSASVE